MKTILYVCLAILLTSAAAMAQGATNGAAGGSGQSGKSGESITKSPEQTKDQTTVVPNGNTTIPARQGVVVWQLRRRRPAQPRARPAAKAKLTNLAAPSDKTRIVL